MSVAVHRRLTFREIVTDPRLALMLALGFGSGMPLLMVFSTQSLLWRESGVTRGSIGLLSYVLLCYSLKFVWAPIIDSVDLPLFTRLLGRRRAWLFVAQVGAAAGLFCLAFSDPKISLRYAVACSVLTAFAGATQDIMVDGWRIEVAPPERQGVMTASYQLGYTLARYAAGAGALYIAAFVNWGTAFVAMAELMVIAILACLLSPRLPDRKAPIRLGRIAIFALMLVGVVLVTGIIYLPEVAAVFAAHPFLSYLVLVAALAPIAWLSLRVAARLREIRHATTERPRNGLDASFVEPLVDLVRRYGYWLIAIFLLVSLYRLPDFVAGTMANTLYIDLHFTKSEIATVSKLFGIWVGMAGAFGGGFAITRYGLMSTLLAGGIAASASHLSFALLAAIGEHRLDFLALAISVDSFASGFAGTVLIAYMSSLTSQTFAPSQYALLSSLYALPGKIVGGQSGFMVDHFGYPAFFTMTSTVGIPVVILCLVIWRHSALQRRVFVEAPADTNESGEPQSHPDDRN